MKRQFDRPRPYDAQACISTQVGRAPKYFVSSSREMTTDMVQPSTDSTMGIDAGWVAVVLRLDAHADFDMLEQLAFPGMRRKLAHLYDLGVHRHVLPKQAQCLRSFLQSTPTRPLCLEACQNHGVSTVRQPVRQMVQHSSSGHHSAGRHDDARSMHIIYSL